MTTFFTADHHFGHKNMLKHEPIRSILFKDINMHDKEIIQRHNSIVTNDDIVYFIGDFVPFKKDMEVIAKHLGKMNGKEKHLILGNHDNAKPFTYINAGFTSVHTSLLVFDKLVLNYDPAIKCLLDNDMFLLCGHVHTLFKVLPEKKVINVGVDVQNFYPISIDEIRRIYYEANGIQSIS